MGFYGNILTNKLTAFFKLIKTDKGTVEPSKAEDTLIISGKNGITVDADASNNKIEINGEQLNLDFKIVDDVLVITKGK